MTVRNPNLDEEIIAYDRLQTDEINKIVDYVVENGSNPNGRYEKWNSGKLVQRASFISAGANSVTVPYPIPFSNVQEVITSGNYVGGQAASVNYLYMSAGISTSSVNVYIRDFTTGVAPTGKISFSYIAYGTWK